MRLPHVVPFSKHPLFFFTACAAGRRPIVACKETLEILEEIWSKSAEHDGWYVGRFMLMPDHLHFFAAPAATAIERAQWSKSWKSISSRRMARQLRVSPPIWQPDTFDHILRSAESYGEKWEYVRRNPVRAGLVRASETWPWQGEIHSLTF